MELSLLFVLSSVPLPSILGKRRRVRATSVKGSKPAKMTVGPHNNVCLKHTLRRVATA